MWKRWWSKLKSSLSKEAAPSAHLKADIYSGDTFGQAPQCSYALANLNADSVLSSCTGPDSGVSASLPDITFNTATEWAFGRATSLYDGQPGSEARAGDPIADCFAIISYDTHTLLAVADGVNWGEPAKRAARAAVAGSVAYLRKELSGLGANGQPPPDTSLVFQHMIKALDPAQQLIISNFGTLTTLVLTVVARLAAPLKKGSLKPASSSSSAPSYQWAAMTLTVGDSSAFIYRQQEDCVEDLTLAASAGAYRDPRWTPGALGYALGEQPDLSNMTCSLTLLSDGDLVFLTSDGVADNFDPFMLKLARQAIVAPHLGFNDGSWSDDEDLSNHGKQIPVMDAAQSHAKKMELLTEVVQQQRRQRQGEQQQRAARGDASTSASAPGCSSGRAGGGTLAAQALVEGLLQHVTEVTEAQRTWAERRHREESRRKSLSREMPSLGTDTRGSSNKDAAPPGKMDHATVAAYLVGGRG